MRIHILREPDAAGVRVEDDVDASVLVKSAGVVDNEDERTEWVEYRFPGSEVIVHRSVHVTKKRWPEGIEGALKNLMEPDDLDAWAQRYVADLVRQRDETGAPLTIQTSLTPAQYAAVERLAAQHPRLTVSR